MATDPRNCGSCGYACGAGQACNQGVCQDCGAGGCQTALVAGCIADLGGGFLQKIHDVPGGLLLDAAANPPGASFPDALGLLGSVLLYADDDSSSLYEIPVGNLGTASPEHVPLSGGGSAGTSQLYVAPRAGGTVLYATATSAQAILIYNGPPALDAGTLLGPTGAGSLGLVSAGGVGFDAGSYPEPFAAIGNDLFVPLNATGQVVRVNVTNPASAQFLATYDLAPLVAGLPGGGVAPDGGPFIASPTQAIARNGFVYVAANVLRYYGDRPGADYGPPLVVKHRPEWLGPGGGLGGCRPRRRRHRLPERRVACLHAARRRPHADARELRRRAQLRQHVPGHLGDQHRAAAPRCDGPAHRLLGPELSSRCEAPQRRPRGAAEHQRLRRGRDRQHGCTWWTTTTNGFVERVGYVNGLTPPTICPTYITDLTVVPAP